MTQMSAQKSLLSDGLKTTYSDETNPRQFCQDERKAFSFGGASDSVYLLFHPTNPRFCVKEMVPGKEE